MFLQTISDCKIHTYAKTCFKSRTNYESYNGQIIISSCIDYGDFYTEPDNIFKISFLTLLITRTQYTI